MITLSWSWFDTWILLAGILCAVASSLVGTFLVLRRMSLLGDAISHAVLPGLAVAFLLTGSRDSWFLFLGAVVVGILTAYLTQWIRSAGNVDEGASMGVVFTSLFALGLILIVQAADRVDLDAGCVLYGSIETTPLDQWTLGGIKMPRVVWILSAVCLLNLSFVILFYKELKITAFDPSLATSSGISAKIMHYSLMTLVAITAVASFESIGNILVIAMMIVPAATALLWTDRLSRVLIASVFIGSLSAGLGHWCAIAFPRFVNPFLSPSVKPIGSVSSAGMIAVATGLLFLVSLLVSPHQGLLFRWWRRQRIALSILSEDVLGHLFRLEEKKEGSSVGSSVRAKLLAGRIGFALAIRSLERNAWIRRNGPSLELTQDGRSRAQQIVRSHRLWERYLVDQAQVPEYRIHSHAEEFEHVTSPTLQKKLDRAADSPSHDPHGSEIPGEP